MAKFDFSDLTGATNCVIFPDDMAKQKELVLDGHMCFLMAKTDKRYDQFGLQVRKIVPISKAQEHFRRSILRNVDRDTNYLQMCESLGKAYPGLEIYLNVGGEVLLKPKKT